MLRASLSVNSQRGKNLVGKSIVAELIASQEPRFELPHPATHPELIAAAMMAAGHIGAADLGVNLGRHLTNALSWLRVPERRLRQRLVEGGPGDPFAPKIAETMLRAGRIEAEALGRIDDLGAALDKIEATLCPCCGREFRGGQISPFQPRTSHANGYRPRKTA
jgi:hypothetical protein